MSGTAPASGAGTPSSQGDGVDIFVRRPFFLRLTQRSSSSYGSAAFIAVVLGLVYGLLRHSVNTTGKENSWFLALTVGLITWLVYYASEEVEVMIRNMRLRLQPDQRLNPAYLPHFQRRFSDRFFVSSFIAMGGLNVAMGHLFGVPETSGTPDYWTLHVGYFLVGGLCGIAVWGILTCLSTLQIFFTEDRPIIDVHSPDSTGGFRFLGESFAKYSWVTALAAACIGEYIVDATWQHDDTKVWRYVWIGVPPFLALVLLLAPAMQVHKVIRGYKARKDAKLGDEMREIRKQLESSKLDDPTREKLQARLDGLAKLRAELDAVAEWPLTKKLLGSHAVQLTGVMSVFTPSAYKYVTGKSLWLLISATLGIS